MIDKPISNKYQVKFLDSELTVEKFEKILVWVRVNSMNYLPKYEPDGDHDGYWVFKFKKEEDKVRFILQWM